MQPDKPFNYWDNSQPNPESVNPPVSSAPIISQPVRSQPVVQPTSLPIQQPVAIQSPIATPQPQAMPIAPVVPITQPNIPTSLPINDNVPTDIYMPEEQVASVDEPENSEPDDDEDLEEESIHWVASESISQEKSSVWFIVFAVIVIGLIAFDVFFLKSYTFSVLVVVMSLALVILNRRPPSQVDYVLSPDHGVYVGEVLHSFDEFKSFGVINDNGNNLIKLMPLKRFSIGLSVYFPTEMGEVIVDILGARLPMEDLKLDVVDTVTRKLHL
jgi:hypothetical protein